MLYSRPKTNVGKRNYNTKPIPKDVLDNYNDAVFHLLKYKTKLYREEEENGVPEKLNNFLGKRTSPEMNELLSEVCLEANIWKGRGRGNDKIQNEFLLSKLVLSDEAKEVSHKWFDEIEKMLGEDLQYMGDWAGKLHGATLRFAGLLHIMEHHDDINSKTFVPKETFENAIKIAKYFLEHAKWAYSMMGADEDEEKAKYILEKLKKNGEMELPRLRIKELCRRFQKIDELIRPLAVLEEHGYIKAFKQEWSGIGRKPDILYKINPKLAEYNREVKSA